MFIRHWLKLRFHGPFPVQSVFLLLGYALLFLLFIGMFNFITAKGLPAYDFSFVLLSFTLLLLLPLVGYSAIITCLSFFFQKEEIQFYFSLPVSRTAVFGAKLIETVLTSGWTVFLALLTFLAAAQLYFRLPLLIYLTGGLSFFLFLLAPIVLAAIVVLLISRLFPIIRAKGILIVIGLLIGSSLVASIRFMQPEKLAGPEGKLRLATFVQNLHHPWQTHLPSEWATNVVFATARHDLRGVTANLGALGLLLAALLALLFFLAWRYYPRVWQEAVLASPPAGRAASGEWFFKLLPAGSRPFIKKDLLAFSRNTVESGSLLTLLPLGAAYFYSINILSRQFHSRLYDVILTFLFIYLFSYFYCAVVIAGLSGRWVLPGVSLERNNFRLIKHSPAGLAAFFRAKFLFGFLPLLLVGEILAAGAGWLIGYSLPALLLSLLITAVFCWGLTLVPLTIGARRADFTVEESLDFIIGGNGFLMLLAECGLIVFFLALVAVPSYFYLAGGFSAAFIISLVAALVLFALIAAYLLRTYRESLAGLGRREV